MNTLNIIIDFDHSDELALAIIEAQKRCTVRKITLHHIFSACAQAENFLDIPKYALKDVIVFVDPCAQRFPNAYGKHGVTPMSTHFTMKHDGKNWHLIDIERAKTCVPSMALQFRLTPIAKEKIIERKMNTDWTWYRSGECFIPTDKFFTGGCANDMQRNYEPNQGNDEKQGFNLLHPRDKIKSESVNCQALAARGSNSKCTDTGNHC